MLLTGRIKLVEKDGGKEVVIEEGTKQAQTCSAEQKQKVKELIAAYVKSGPALASSPAPAPPAAGRGRPRAEIAQGRPEHSDARGHVDGGPWHRYLAGSQRGSCEWPAFLAHPRQAAESGRPVGPPSVS